jgi:glycosyltransferase involved in cell wall biosynthesis
MATSDPQPHHRPRLLAVGPAADLSSYSRVLHSTFRHLSADWEIHHFGVNYRGEPFDDGWSVLPNPSIGDRYGVAQIPGLVERLKPDVIFLFNCFTVLPRYSGLAERLGEGRPKIVAYSPLLGEPIDPRRARGLGFFDALVGFSPGVKGYFEFLLQGFLEEGSIPRMPRVEAIPHGLDGDRFFPLGERRWEDGRFVVLNANRNSPRKRVDITLEGFALFAQGKPPGVRLHLHMGECLDGRMLQELIGRLGIADRVHLACAEPGGHPEIPDAELNRLYNACDVGINTASAEGFGMVSLEHAATGAPQIVPGHHVCGEVWEGHAEVLEPVELSGSRLVKEGIVSAAGVAAALERLYSDRAHRERMSALALANARRPELQWRRIAERWSALLGELARP